MKEYLKRGCLGLVIGVLVGGFLGILLHFINWFGLGVGLSDLAPSESNFVLLMIIFAVIGAVLGGFLGLLIGGAIAALKKPPAE